MSSAEEDVYDVEAIVGDRIVKGRKQYLIKWLGYPSSQNTWEYEDNIFSEDLKEKYEASKKKPKKAKSTKESGTTKKFEKKVTDEWADVVKSITGVTRNNEGGLEIEYLTYDNKRGVCTNDEMHIKAPIRLLEFYESNLSFPE